MLTTYFSLLPLVFDSESVSVDANNFPSMRSIFFSIRISSSYNNGMNLICHENIAYANPIIFPKTCITFLGNNFGTFFFTKDSWRLLQYFLCIFIFFSFINNNWWFRLLGLQWLSITVIIILKKHESNYTILTQFFWLC